MLAGAPVAGRLEDLANQAAAADHDDLTGMQVSAIDEIDLGISDDIPPTELQEIDRELGIEEEPEEEVAEEPKDDEDDEETFGDLEDDIEDELE